MSTTVMGRRTNRARQIVVAGGLAVALAGTSFAGTAGASEPNDEAQLGDDVHSVATLIRCIASKGVVAPGEQGISTAWIDQVIAAARDCGVELPEALVAEARRQAAEAESRRQCLETAGIQRPAPGQIPTSEAIAAFKAALVTCGITPPGSVEGAPHTERPKAERPKAQRSKSSTNRRQRTRATRARVATKKARR